MKYYGIYQGFVTSLKDPEKRGRIKCTCPDVLDTSESGWCEPCFLNACDDGGDFFLPPLGEGVWIMFIDGDVNRPVYLGGWWSKDRTPFENDYSSPRDARFINYAGSTIKLYDGKIEIFSEDNSIVKIENIDDVSRCFINGDLEVTGSINSDDGFSSDMVLVKLTDCDYALDTRVLYYLETSGLNKPSGSGWIFLKCFSISGNNVFQIATTMGGQTPCVWARSRDYLGVWGDWVRLSQELSTLSITRTANNYCNDSSIANLKAYRKSGILFLEGNLNLSSAMPSGTSEVQIATISNWKAVSPVIISAPAIQGSGTIHVNISSTGAIRIANLSGTSASLWHRFWVAVPEAV